MLVYLIKSNNKSILAIYSEYWNPLHWKYKVIIGFTHELLITID